jgi:glycosyltransferase involved in cell wall biosynthesis
VTHEPTGAVRQPLTIVVPTRDRPDLLQRCLEHLVVGGLDSDELVIVDSASRGDDAARIASAYDAKYVRVDLPGVSRARNAGWREATHELVAFVDDDARAHEGFRDAMARALGAPQNAFVTGWIGVPPGQEDAIDPQPYIVLPDVHRLDHDAPRLIGAGANMGVRRSALAKVGGFDERLGAGAWFGAAEEADLFDRLIAIGDFGEYRPEVRVDHDAWRTRRQRFRQQWNYGKATGARMRLLVRRDRDRVPLLAKRTLWRRGVILAIRRAREGWYEGAALTVVRMAGVVTAFVVAWPRLRETWPPAR